MDARIHVSDLRARDFVFRPDVTLIDEMVEEV